LKTKSKIEYCKIIPDSIYFSQKSTKAISFAKININQLNIIQIIKKIFEKLFFILLIFSFSHFELSSEKIGIKSIKIGHSTIKGIFIILR